MRPGTHLRAHCGPSNHRLRLHLPVVVPPCPERACALRVGDEARAWREGEVLVFDDSFDHEAWVDERAVGERVVLMVDVWHPELSLDDRSEIYSVQGAYNFFGVGPEDTGFVAVPRSHYRWQRRRAVSAPFPASRSPARSG